MTTDCINFIQTGRNVINIEQKALIELQSHLDDQFQKCCELILNCNSKVVIIGMGKSGHIGRKIAATLASTGTPSFFVHPGEASHGDLGMISPQDVVIGISYSGKTDELVSLLPLLRQQKIPLITITGNPNSTLAKAAKHHLNVHVSEEACPLGLAPTASTTATLAMGDALAVTLLRARGFSANDFARFHPSGALGKRLLMQVKDLMHSGDQLPKVSPTCSIAKALVTITQHRLGMTTVTNPVDQTLIGVFTDGDLRRALDKNVDIRTCSMQEVMTKESTTVTASLLAAECLGIMQTKQITSLPVIDSTNRVVGVVHLHDLLKAGVV